MSTHRHIDAICVVVLVLTLLITVLFMNGEAFGLQVIVDEDAEDYAGALPFTENDRNGTWDSSGATKITLSGDSAAVVGGGAYAFGGDVVISSSGKYVISGGLNDGSIIVDTNNGAKVWILLSGVSVSCSEGACLDVEQADKVFLTLAEGTDNSMSSLGFSEENRTAGMDGTLFSRDDLTINGSGSLTVNAAAEHGIVCNDELVIAGGKITVTAPGDALHANDSLRIASAELRLTAGDDGAAITGPESELYFESGSLAISSTGDGINAENSVRILGGTISIDTADDGISAAGVQGEVEITDGTLTIKAKDKGITAENIIRLQGGKTGIESENDGLSAVGEILIQGGELTIRTADDGIHSDSAVWISGGSIQIPACYEGIEAVTIDVSGGEISIYPEDDGLNANGVTGTGGFGGMRGGMGMRPGNVPGRPNEAETMNRSPQTGSGDDAAHKGPTAGFGENGKLEFTRRQEETESPAPEEETPPAGPEEETPPAIPEGTERPPIPTEAEASPPMEQGGEIPNLTETPPAPPVPDPGAGTEGGEAQETWIHVSGGSITVINSTARDADGLDSNGDIIISGGKIRVSMVNSGSNSALDYGRESGGVMEIFGGDVVACGSYAMAEGFDTSSGQCSILYNIKRGAAAGTMIALEDSDENILLSYEAPCSFSSVAISCPEMKLGERYIVVIGDSVEEITLEEVSASFGDAQSEGFGGPMNWGRLTFRPGGGQNGSQSAGQNGMPDE